MKSQQLELQNKQFQKVLKKARNEGYLSGLQKYSDKISEKQFNEEYERQAINAEKIGVVLGELELLKIISKNQKQLDDFTDIENMFLKKKITIDEVREIIAEHFKA